MPAPVSGKAYKRIHSKLREIKRTEIKSMLMHAGENINQDLSF
jgi:hypothetical protein